MNKRGLNTYTRLPLKQHAAGPTFTFRDLLGEIGLKDHSKDTNSS